MVSITVIAVGKLKEKHYLGACTEYMKRLGAYCKFQMIEIGEHRLPENPSEEEIAIGLKKEAELIFGKIPKGAWVCVMTPEGKMISSEELSKTLEEVKTRGKSSLCFILGSSFGMDETVKKNGDFRLSLSPMIFPHHLARVMVLEQIYRAESIGAGSKYHK